MALSIFRIIPDKIQYPKYLENQKLPLMQTAIQKKLQTMRIFSHATAQLISEYASCPADQVETRAMIAYFEEVIPSIIILNLKADHGEVSACFDEEPCQREDMHRNSTALKNSPERRLAALAAAYFAHRNFDYKMQLSPEEREHMDPNNQEYYDFFGRIPGITIINQCIATEDVRVSHEITFGQQKWYEKIDIVKILLGEPKKVLRFLRQKGYEKSEKPARGQIVVYHTRTKVSHYGKISEIDSEGQIMVISKFGRAHFYRHRIELTQFHYGNSVTFLNEPIKKLEERH